MESPNSPLQPLPRASFVCENCSRHVVVVLDSSFHSSNTTLQTSKQSKTEVSLAANAEDPLPLQFHCVDEGQFHRSGATTTPLDDGAATCAPLQRPLQHQLQHQLQPPVPSANESCRSPLSSCVPSLYADPADTSGASVSVDEGVGADSGMMYPLCAACLDADIAEVEPSTAHEKRLIRKYERALRRLQRLSTARAQEEVATDAATSTLAQLRQLEEEERKLEAEISVIEASTAQKEAQKRAVVAELAELHMWHAEFWLLYTNHWLRMMRHGERRRAMERLFVYIGTELRRLKRLNVVTDAFHIWTYKFLPSINKCRIVKVGVKRRAHRKADGTRISRQGERGLKPWGTSETETEGDSKPNGEPAHSGSAGDGPKLNGRSAALVRFVGRISSPSCPSWAEVNTGWGYLCMLLDVFYRKCQAHPSNYRLVPRGQFSFLIRKKDGAVLPLHGGGGEVGLSRFFYSNKRFDSAMMAFLECVKELADLLAAAAEDRSKDRAICRLFPFPELPYEIEGDRVGGFSIRLQLNQDERWTKALKLLLIDMKWLLEYIERICLVTGAAP